MGSNLYKITEMMVLALVKRDIEISDHRLGDLPQDTKYDNVMIVCQEKYRIQPPTPGASA